MNKTRNTVIGIIVAVILIGAVAFFAIKNSNSNTQAAVPVTVPAADQGEVSGTTTTTTTTTTSSIYKDGTYSAVGNYVSPGGAQTLNVTLTLKNDIVTDATVTSGAIDPTSARHQADFIGGYKQYVIGKDISTLNLTKVSGASLTPKGFNDAVAKIKAEAQA